MDAIDQAPESLIALHELIERLELTDAQRERWRRIQGDAADVLMDAFAAAALSLVRPAAAEAMALAPPPPPANVDVGEKDAKKRIAAAWKVISAAVEALDASSNDTARFNARVYLLRLGWHESADYTAREQGRGGPARGLFQAQRGSAVDALDFAFTKRPEQFEVMAGYGGTDRAGLKKALDGLAKATGDALPAGNLVTDVLTARSGTAGDAFAAGLARLYFKRLGSHTFPTDIAKTADDWFDNYNKSDASLKKTKTAKFVADADRLEEHRKKMLRADGGLM